jgi:hypothetical protein
VHVNNQLLILWSPSSHRKVPIDDAREVVHDILPLIGLVVKRQGIQKKAVIVSLYGWGRLVRHRWGSGWRKSTITPQQIGRFHEPTVCQCIRPLIEHIDDSTNRDFNLEIDQVHKTFSQLSCHKRGNGNIQVQVLDNSRVFRAIVERECDGQVKK